jgi:hypothetical protein
VTIDDWELKFLLEQLDRLREDTVRLARAITAMQGLLRRLAGEVPPD